MHQYAFNQVLTDQLVICIIYKSFPLTPQVPCWLRPRDRTRSPEVLNNVSRPTTLPLRIPPRISITQADTDRFTRYSALFQTAGYFSPQGGLCWTFHFFHLWPSNVSFSPRGLVMKQKMACHRVTPHWVRRVLASPCTPPSPRAREESPSSTALTRTTTCRPRRFHATPPSPVKGETRQARQKKNKLCYEIRNITVVS